MQLFVQYQAGKITWELGTGEPHEAKGMFDVRCKKKESKKDKHKKQKQSGRRHSPWPMARDPPSQKKTQNTPHTKIQTSKKGKLELELELKRNFEEANSKKTNKQWPMANAQLASGSVI